MANLEMAVAELNVWTPPTYRWLVDEVYGAHLPDALNSADKTGWEIFQVIPSKLPEKYLVVCRRPIEEE